MTQERGALHFEVDARHIRQLGQELVADRVTAISELVKNAYDADATRVQVIFVGASDGPGGTLTIRDNGTGMSLDDVRDRWMRISTDFKQRNSKSTLYKRPRAGQKGIGRFAAETLGRQLVLTSKAHSQRERITVTFNWDQDYQAGTSLQSIGNTYVVEQAGDDEQGTTLIIDQLHHRWADEDLERVRRALLMLQPPFPVTETATDGRLSSSQRDFGQGFEVELWQDGQPRPLAESGLDDFLDAATALIEGEADGMGGGVWRLTSRLFNLNDTQTTTDAPREAGPFIFRAFYFVYSKAAIGSITVANARHYGNLFSGVRIYRDEMRIPPYGERGNDWLRLDEESRRRSLALIPISNLNFFGQVHISRDNNPLLVDTASREGVVENRAFEGLRTFVRDSLLWGALRVGSARERKTTTTDKSRKPPPRKVLVERAVAAAQTATTTSEPVAREEAFEQIEIVRKEAKQADQEESERTKQLLGEIEILRILASLGTSIAVFSHEVRGVLNVVVGALGDIECDAGQLTESQAYSICGHLESAKAGVSSLGELAGFINSYVSQIRRRVKQPQPLCEIIRSFVDAFDRTLNRRGISIQYVVEPQFIRTQPMGRTELEAVLFNFLSNAIKAMDKEGHSERRIRITAGLDGAEILLRFQDTGHGIPESDKLRVFDAFFTTSAATDETLGVGTGIGLKVVWDIAAANEGSVRLGTPDEGFVTCFELRLPQWKPSDIDGEAG